MSRAERDYLEAKTQAEREICRARGVIGDPIQKTCVEQTAASVFFLLDLVSPAHARAILAALRIEKPEWFA